MSYDPYPGMGLRTWHVVVFLGLVVLVADIVSLQMLGSKTNSFTFVPAQRPDSVEVLVAATDFPVGASFTREDLASDKVVKTKRVPKENVPSSAVTNREALVDKCLTRNVRAGEMFIAQDLSDGWGRALPDGGDWQAEKPVEVA